MSSSFVHNMRFVNLKTTNSSSVKPFYYDSVTRKSKWGSQTNTTFSAEEKASPIVILNCSKTGRKFEYQAGKSVWLEPEPPRKVFVSSSSIPAPNGVVVCRMNDGTEFLYNTETRESYLESNELTTLVSSVRQNLSQQEQQLLPEDVQGELMEALQFTYGVLYTKHGKSVDQLFPSPIINCVEQAFLQPEANKATLMLLHQGLVLAKSDFEAWKKEADFTKWLQALHALLADVLQTPKFAHEFQGKVPFRLNDADPFVEAAVVLLPSYFQLEVSTRVRILLVLARWMEHTKRVMVSSPEAYYRGECLGSDFYEDEMVWYFPGIAPYRLYSKTTWGTKTKWYCFCQSVERLTDTINALLATSELLSPKLQSRLSLLKNHLQATTTALPTCTLCNATGVDLLGGKCANCIGILPPPSKPVNSQDEEDSHLEIVSTGEEAPAVVADDVRIVCSNASSLSSSRAKSIDLLNDDDFASHNSLFEPNEVNEKYNEPASSLDTGDKQMSSVSSHEQGPAPLLPNYGTTPAKEEATASQSSSTSSSAMYIAPPRFDDNDFQQQQQQQSPAPVNSQPATQKDDSFENSNSADNTKPFTQPPPSSSED